MEREPSRCGLCRVGGGGVEGQMLRFFFWRSLLFWLLVPLGGVIRCCRSLTRVIS